MKIMTLQRGYLAPAQQAGAIVFARECRVLRLSTHSPLHDQPPGNRIQGRGFPRPGSTESTERSTTVSRPSCIRRSYLTLLPSMSNMLRSTPLTSTIASSSCLYLFM